MLCLVAYFNEESIRVPLPRQEARLGSAPFNDVSIPFPGVSRAHAILLPQAGGIVVRDLGSKNGLRVDGRRVDEAVLVPGATVQVGRAILTIEDASTSDVELAVSLPDHRERDPEPTGTDSGSLTGSGAADALRFVREIEMFGSRRLRRDVQRILPDLVEILDAGSAVIMEIDRGEWSVIAAGGPLPSAELLDRIASAVLRDRKIVPSAIRTLQDVTVLTARSAGKRRIRCVAVTFDRDAAGIEAWQRDVFEFAAHKFLGVDGEVDVDEAETEQASLLVPEGMVIGESVAMRGLLSQIKATIHSRMDVLLWGETGTGKELFARMVHASGPNARGPFVAINCAAIPSELLESELFGVHGRVATGVDPRPGLFQQADGGSIFLDEIGELAEPLQAKLLRVLQEREVLPLGAPAPRRIDVRVIAASNRNLLERVQQGRFRADLYYRLRGLQFHIPPLRERREDIPALVLEFVTRAAGAHSKSIAGISRKALHLLMQHEWPGNVRELQSEVERAVLLCPPGGALQAEHFAPIRWAVEQRGPQPAAVENPLRDLGARDPVPLQQRVDELERRAIEEVLASTRGNKSEAARILGITRNGLALKMKRLGINGH
ncbi:MAG TPA: sigma 54-interacting transcriptional regulator [Thermoanaerobaculia bacterium]|nr:sigma 54-interacting transcriptional regulator [Thermoanaerobaculia bacterium]